jgi:hypothetical protein
MKQFGIATNYTGSWTSALHSREAHALALRSVALWEKGLGAFKYRPKSKIEITAQRDI